jgi:copper chaperone
VASVYSVPGVSCQHCVNAITTEVSQIPGVSTVVVDLATKTVTVESNNVDDAAVRAAIDEAGYAVAAG